MVVSKTKSSALLVVALLISLLVVVVSGRRVANRPGKKSAHGRRRLEDDTGLDFDTDDDPNNRIGQYRFDDDPFGAGQTAFEYCKSETISEKATEIQKDIPYFQSLEHFLPICTEVCVDIMLKSWIPPKFRSLAGSYAPGLCNETYPGLIIPGLPSDFIRGELEKYGYKPPEEDQENGICGCIFRCDFENASIYDCLQYCVGNTGVEGITQEEMKKWCQGACPDDDPLCVDACDCAFQCEEDKETRNRDLRLLSLPDDGGNNNDGEDSMALVHPIDEPEVRGGTRNLNTDQESPFRNCVAECKSLYNGYAIFEFLHDRAVRLSDCVYENEGCDAVEKDDWNNNSTPRCSTIKCRPNDSYDPTTDLAAGENYQVLQQNICEEIITEGTGGCPVGDFCSDKFEECDPSPTVTTPAAPKSTPSSGPSGIPGQVANVAGAKKYSPSPNLPVPPSSSPSSSPSGIPGQVGNVAGAKKYSPSPNLPVPSAAPSSIPSSAPRASTSGSPSAIPSDGPSSSPSAGTRTPPSIQPSKLPTRSPISASSPAGSSGSANKPTPYNILAHATVTLDPRYQWAGQAVPDNIINGDNNHEDFWNYPSTRIGHCLFRTEFAPWVQIDLGSPKLVDGVTLWHYWGDQRQYCSQGLKVSTDGETWTTIFDTGHKWGPYESPDGNHYAFEAQPVRYLRHYSGPSNLNNGVHFLRMEVQGKEIPVTTDEIISDIHEKIGRTNSMITDVLGELKQTNEVIQKMEQTCIAPAARRRLDRSCNGEGLKVQCGFDREGSIISEHLKDLYVEEGSRKINTGFFYDIKSACSDLVDVSISVLTNEVDEKQSAFLTKIINANGGGELPRIYIAPRKCREEGDGEDPGAADTVCEPSPSGKRFYDIQVTATDEATDEAVHDTCRVIVFPKDTQERELRGRKHVVLSRQAQEELNQASPVRTIVGSLSLQVVARMD